MIQRRSGWRVVAISAIGILALMPGQRAQAATIAVNSALDSIDVAGGSCAAVTTSLLAADDDRTVREAICAANNNGPGSDTITFAAGLPPILLTSDLPDVTSSIVFAGASDGSTRLDGQGSRRSGFRITQSVNVTVRGMTFQNGQGLASGGAIDQTVVGGLGIERSTFINNAAVSGGAICIAGVSTLKVTGSTFAGNEAGANGGAIWLTFADSIQLTDSTFEGNIANESGGALGMAGDLADGMRISGTDFLSNEAVYFGGALYLDRDLGGLEIRDESRFVSNRSIFDSGGAVSVLGALTGKVNISDSTLAANSTTVFGFGGFLYVGDGNTLVSITIKDSIVNGNVSADGGGVFWIDGTVTKLTIKDSIIEGNIAGDEGGVFRLNTANQISINQTSMSFNHALGGDGGVLYLSDTRTVKITGSTVSDNTASQFGGAFSLNNTVAGNVSIKNSTLSANEAGSYGGALWIDTEGQAAINITGSTFDQNIASGPGGALSISSDTPVPVVRVSIKGTLFDENQSTSDSGGAVYLQLADVSTVSISKSVLTENSANSYGGAIVLSGGKLTVKTSTFSGNTSGGTGNGAALYLSNAQLFMDNSLIDSNNASAADLAAIRIASSPAGGVGTLKNNCFENNTGLALSDSAVHVVTRNWWGHAEGPGAPSGTNPSGGGYEATAPNTTPWLTVRPNKCGAP
jgi:hypothetical protein